MVKAKALLDMGFAFPCAFCVRMTVPRHGAPGCNKTACGGPFVGRSFPEYKGMMTRSTLATHCFRCGASAKEAIVTDDGGYLGVCEKHLNSTIKTSSDTLVPTHSVPEEEAG